MSRYIDHDKPLSDEDKEYLLTRSGGEYLIEINERRFGHLSKKKQAELAKQVDSDHDFDTREEAAHQTELDELPDFDDDVIEKVAPLTFNQLRQKATKLGLGGDGTKDELQDKLLNYFQDLKESPAEQAKVAEFTD